MKAGKVVRKQEKDVQKTMLALKIFSAKTNIFVNKLNGKIGAESVAYTLNFTYTEKNTKSK